MSVWLGISYRIPYINYVFCADCGICDLKLKIYMYSFLVQAEVCLESQLISLLFPAEVCLRNRYTKRSSKYYNFWVKSVEKRYESLQLCNCWFYMLVINVFEIGPRKDHGWN